MVKIGVLNVIEFITIISSSTIPILFFEINNFLVYSSNHSPVL